MNSLGESLPHLLLPLVCSSGGLNSPEFLVEVSALQQTTLSANTTSKTLTQEGKSGPCHELFQAKPFPIPALRLTADALMPWVSNTSL